MFETSRHADLAATGRLLPGWMVVGMIFLSTVILFACTNTDEQTSAEETNSSSGTVVADSSKVVAKLGDEVITEAELDVWFDLRKKFGRFTVTEDPEQMEENRKIALDELIQRRLVMAESKKLGIGVDDKEIQEELDGELEAMGREQAEQQLQALGLKIADLKAELVYARLSEALFKDQLPQLPEITEEDIHNFYEEKKEDYFHLVEVAHILILTPEDGNEGGTLEARKKTEDLIRQINEGADFAELAKEYSQDPGSANTGGAYPPAPRGKYVKEFEEAAFSQEPGEVTQEPVQTRYGFHIIKTLSFEYVPFEEVHDQIKMNLPRIRKDQQIPIYIDRLKQETGIEILL